MVLKKKVAEAALSNFAGTASSFFGNARVPSSIVLGSSLAALFALSNFGSSSDRTPTERFLIKVYRICSWTAFILSLNAVITCTVATTSILHGSFDPMAESAYMLLKREFEYEFVSVRWSMTTALLLFIVIVTVRVILEFKLLEDPARRDTGRFVALSAVALVTHLLDYINGTLYCWSNFGEMTLEVFALVLGKAFDEPSSMAVLSIAAGVGAAYYGFRAAFSDKDKWE